MIKEVRVKIYSGITEYETTYDSGTKRKIRNGKKVPESVKRFIAGNISRVEMGKNCMVHIYERG